MIRLVFLLMMLGLSGQPVASQAPPSRPDMEVDQDRPPERPDEATSEPKADTSATEAGSETPSGQRDAFESEPYGPPMPPGWYLARESDQDFSACRLALSMLGTVYRVMPTVTEADDRDCGIARPIMVQRILPDLELQGGAMMRCDTARALALWARDFARPAAATLPNAPRLTGFQLGTTYDCRARVGTGSSKPKLSEHALGNAIDIMGFTFDGADPLQVSPREDSGDQTEAFQRAVRGAACLFFTTVLGPGANAAHDNHLHLDVAARRGGWRLCQ